MYTAALLLAGESPSVAQLDFFLTASQRRQLCWVAADGGFALASDYGVKVEAVIGDFDSLPAARETQEYKKIIYPEAKDDSDRNLALSYLYDQGHRNVVQIGGGAGRSDHFLAMIYDFFHWTAKAPDRLDKQNTIAKLWLTHREAIYYVQATESLDLSPEARMHLGYDNTEHTKLVSIFPLEQDTVIHSDGLSWPLSLLRDNGRSYSLSNWLESGGAPAITVERGSILVFCPYH